MNLINLKKKTKKNKYVNKNSKNKKKILQLLQLKHKIMINNEFQLILLMQVVLIILVGIITIFI